MKRRHFLLAGAAALLWRPATAAAGVDEGALLLGLWRREMAAAFAYDAAVMPTYQQAEADHAAAIATELAAVGLATPPPPSSIDELDVAAQQLATTRSESAAVELEESMVDLYKEAVQVLPDAKIAMTVATILGSHAQHLLILRDQAD